MASMSAGDTSDSTVRRRSGSVLEGRTLAELMADFRSRYFISGEINSEVADQNAKMEEIAERYADGE